MLREIGVRVRVLACLRFSDKGSPFCWSRGLGRGLQHMELFFDRIMEARELQVSAGLGGSAWAVGGAGMQRGVASASAPSAESRSAAFAYKESKRD